MRVVRAKVKKIDKLYEAYGADMARQLARYQADEFALIEAFLARTTELLAEHTARLRLSERGPA